MSIAIIYQRDRNSAVISGSATVLTTATKWRSFAYDGSFLWACGNADLTQIDLANRTQSRTVATTDNYAALTYDGEYFWGAVDDALFHNGGLGQITKDGQRVNFVGSITPVGPDGLAYDGASLWACYYTGGVSTISQIEMYSAAIDKTFTITPRLNGLVFDGEFLVGTTADAGRVDLVYIDRNTGAIVRTAQGDPTGATWNALAFDGEYFYTLVSF